jgi:hypothetical protein
LAGQEVTANHHNTTNTPQIITVSITVTKNLAQSTLLMN